VAARLEPGIYLLDTDAPGLDRQNYWGRRHILIVSHINLTVKAGPRDALAWATDLATGDPVPDLTLTFSNDNGSRLGSVTTDAAGVARLDLPSVSRGSLLVYSDKPFTAGSQPVESGHIALGFWPARRRGVVRLPCTHLHRPAYLPTGPDGVHQGRYPGGRRCELQPG